MRPAAYDDVNGHNFGGQLASVTTSGANNIVLTAVPSVGNVYGYFVGLTDWDLANGTWFWTDGKAYDWTNWSGGEPNNMDNERFTEVQADSTWRNVDLNCAAAYVMVRPTLLPETSPGEVPCAQFGTNYIYLDELAAPTETPYIERRLYWQKVFRITLGAGGAYSQERSYTHGTSETNQSEETFTKTYSAPAPDDKIMLLALWQLRERYLIADREGTPWHDPKYVLNGQSPYLDQGLAQDYLPTTVFDQPDVQPP